MKKKIQLGLVLAAAFLAGGLLTNMYGTPEAAAKKPFPFIKRVSLSDDMAGNAAGWNPGILNQPNIFNIQDSDISAATSSVIINIEDDFAAACTALLPPNAVGTFTVYCFPDGPLDGAKLHYMVINP